MFISFACICGEKIKIKKEHAGKNFRCHNCGAVLMIPHDADDATIDKKDEETLRGSLRFLTTIILMGVTSLILGIYFINWNIKTKHAAEVRIKFHESLTEAIKSATTYILANEYEKAADVLRKVRQLKPRVDTDDTNGTLLDKAEVLLEVVETVSTDSKARDYLNRFDDGNLLDISQGKSGLTGRLIDLPVKKAIDNRLARLVPPIQDMRRRAAKNNPERVSHLGSGVRERFEERQRAARKNSERERVDDIASLPALPRTTESNGKQTPSDIQSEDRPLHPINAPEDSRGPGLQRLGYVQQRCMVCKARRGISEIRDYSDKKHFGLCSDCGRAYKGYTRTLNDLKAGIQPQRVDVELKDDFVDRIKKYFHEYDSEERRAIGLVFASGQFASDDWNTLVHGE